MYRELAVASVEHSPDAVMDDHRWSSPLGWPLGFLPPEAVLGVGFVGTQVDSGKGVGGEQLLAGDDPFSGLQEVIHEDGVADHAPAGIKRGIWKGRPFEKHRTAQ